MTDKPDLLPCPFCAGEAKERWGGCAEFYGHEHQSVSIECDQCSVSLTIDTSCNRDGLTSKGYEFACSCCNDVGAEARKRWNTRAADKVRIAELTEQRDSFQRVGIQSMTERNELLGLLREAKADIQDWLQSFPDANEEPSYRIITSIDATLAKLGGES